MPDHNEKALETIFDFYGYLNSFSRYFKLRNNAIWLVKILFRLEQAFQSMSTFDKVTKIFPSIDV